MSGLQNGQGVGVLTGLSNSSGIGDTTGVGSYVLSVIGTMTIQTTGCSSPATEYGA